MKLLLFAAVAGFVAAGITIGAGHTWSSAAGKPEAAHIAHYRMQAYAASVATSPAHARNSKTHRRTSSGPPGKGWQMVFHDDFTGTRLNTTLWNTCWSYMPAAACTNVSEAEWYRPANVQVAKGMLSLTAKVEPHWLSYWKPVCCKYTSGMVTTSGHRSFKYGYFEARIKYAPGYGFWTAFWLNPYHKARLPEIDAAEHLGSEPNNLINAYHWPRTAETQWVANLPYVAGHTLEAGWHTVAVNWEPGSLTWYVDGKQAPNGHYYSCKAGTPEFGTKFGPSCGPITSVPMSLNLNFAVGDGSVWKVGKPNSSTPFPSTVQVDWVRVWQKK